MRITTDLLASLPDDSSIVDVRIGAFWTAVVAERDGRRRCGLASALHGADHHQRGTFPIPDAGRLTTYRSLQLAQLVRSESLLEASVGMAAINALLDVDEASCVELNAEAVIAERGQGKNVVIVGHFPFIPRLEAKVGRLSVLEQRPGPEDMPAEAAPDVLPQADVVAITSTSLINGTFEELIGLCRPDAFVLLLGPSTPMSPLVFDYGVDVASGSRVDDIDTVLRLVCQGATFQQIHRRGVSLLTMARPETE